jgi:GT2 family glycosyltransferase
MGKEDELLIVDNNSPGQLQWINFIKNYSAKANCLSSDKNLGFGKAVNWAAQNAKNDYLVLVNPDCRVESMQFRFWVEDTIQKQPFDVLAPRICYPDKRPQPNLGGFASPLTFILQFLKVGALLRKLNLPSISVSLFSKVDFILPSYIKNYLQNFNKTQARIISADWVSGAFMLIKRKSFFEINGFDDGFFMYCEDEDLCRRLKLKNKVILWSPDFTVIHTEGGTDLVKKQAQELSLAQKERFLSRLYYINKWFGAFYLYFFRCIYGFGFIFLFFYHLIIGQLSLALSELKFSFELLVNRVGPCS